mmetsp:Transcript_28442/g.27248  ORF Transcript_28442/g.27248 Transcript_28442/m.27248 type:complete len:205 (-) Transcript_28442:37-651(-)
MTILSFGTVILIFLTFNLSVSSFRKNSFIKSGNIIQHTFTRLPAVLGYRDLYGINDEVWRSKLVEVENYFDHHDKLPSRKDGDPAIRALGQWVETQKKNLKNNEYIMNNNVEIRNIWIAFIEKHVKKVYTKEETWRARLLEVEKYFNDNTVLPSPTDDVPAIKVLGVWVRTQRYNHKNHLHIMKDNIEIRSTWIDFSAKCSPLL